MGFHSSLPGTFSRSLLRVSLRLSLTDGLAGPFGTSFHPAGQTFIHEGQSAAHLENMPATPLLNNGFESAPATIRRVLSTLDTGLLLDLAHARVAAAFQQMTVEDYLMALPLGRVWQIHVSGVREVDGMLRDAHEPLQEADYEILNGSCREPGRRS